MYGQTIRPSAGQTGNMVSILASRCHFGAYCICAKASFIGLDEQSFSVPTGNRTIIVIVDHFYSEMILY